ncbi:hypothetical protein K2224_08660 [Streptomyces sp. BHT-5-2]|uniref:hypothetical protein n=1 Tax=Streptomyces sp. BHT-5-2 TaxID=2866715 RepID=UPI001C8E8B8F|nr:hypothetical protein [Streptomyces sp. BHT-5-2]QZL06706.1 hypothetical protein K2224_08660 [Streptomyces sp. BHT-5-2]
MTKGGAATAGVAAVGLLLAGCNPGGEGIRKEGSASHTPAPRGAVTSSPAPTPGTHYKKVNAVKLLAADPKVGADVKRAVAKPCAADEYPIEVTYASLTGSKAPDVIVNVMTCADSVGLGAYVYRERPGARNGYDNVYANEQPSVYAGVSKGELEVSKQTYAAGDKVCCPSGEDVMTYHWANDHFTEYDRYHTDYSKTAVGGTGDDATTGADPDTTTDPTTGTNADPTTETADGTPAAEG